MLDGNKILAIIPARGGSKRIPNKNLAILGGKSLLQRTIETANEVDAIDRLIVSTDSAIIKHAAESFGAEVPFLRPSNLSGDLTPGIAPILHAIEEQPGYEILLVLQVTSPFRTSSDIIEVLKLLGCQKTDAVISVCEAAHHPNWMKRVDHSGHLVPYSDEPLVSRSQDLPSVYALNGAIYAVRTQVLKKHKTWHVQNAVPYVMPVNRSLDIDTEFDLQTARILANTFERLIPQNKRKVTREP